MLRAGLAFDRAPDSLRKDADGRLHCKDVCISKAAVNPYYGREIANYRQLGLDPARVYSLLRCPDELLKGAASFRSVPLLKEHRLSLAADGRDNDLIVGTIGSNVRFIDPYLFADVVVWSGDAIRQIESGQKKQLSAGYHYTADMTPGTWSGQKFDGVMRGISAKHVSLVDRGRAGADVSIAA